MKEESFEVKIPTITIGGHTGSSPIFIFKELNSDYRHLEWKLWLRHNKLKDYIFPKEPLNS
jgi:hypothetical protein